MRDSLADPTEWERHEDDSAELERIRDELRDGLQQIEAADQQPALFAA
ncbi:hypothetical protein [Isoptericola sp. NPDC057191]